MAQRLLTWLSDHYPELLLAAVALLCYGLLDASGFDHHEPDSQGYISPARAMLAGEGFSHPTPEGGYSPEFKRTPTYPMYLAGFLVLFGEQGLLLSVWAQRLLWTALVVFALPSSRSATTRRQIAARVFGKAICLLLPTVLINASLLLSDTLFAALVWIGILLTARAFEKTSFVLVVLAGMTLGVATLTRTVGLLLPVALALLTLVWMFRQTTVSRRRVAGLALVMVLSASALPLVWCARNYDLAGHFTLSYRAASNLVLHREATISSLVQEGETFGNSRSDRYAQLVHERRGTLPGIVAFQQETGLNRFEVDAVGRNVAVVAIQKRPFSYLGSSIYHGFNLFMAPADSQMLAHAAFGKELSITMPLRTAVQKRNFSAVTFQTIIRTFGIVFLLGVPSLLLVRHLCTSQRTLLAFLLFASSGYFVVITSAVVPTTGRFLLPILPAIGLAYQLLSARATEEVSQSPETQVARPKLLDGVDRSSAGRKRQTARRGMSKS